MWVCGGRCPYSAAGKKVRGLHCKTLHRELPASGRFKGHGQVGRLDVAKVALGHIRRLMNLQMDSHEGIVQRY